MAVGPIYEHVYVTTANGLYILRKTGPGSLSVIEKVYASFSTYDGADYDGLDTLASPSAVAVLRDGMGWVRIWLLLKALNQRMRTFTHVHPLSQPFRISPWYCL